MLSYRAGPTAGSDLRQGGLRATMSVLSIVNTSIITVGTAAITAGVAGIVGARAGRDKANREHALQFDVFLRADRARTYPVAWSIVASWKRPEINSLELPQLATSRRALQEFYAGEGGLYLSRRSVENLIALWNYADELLDAGAPLEDGTRGALADRAHALRRCLTRYLGGRSKSGSTGCSSTRAARCPR